MLSDKNEIPALSDLLTHMETAAAAFETIDTYLTTELNASEKKIYFDVHDKGWAISYHKQKLSKKIYICNIVVKKDFFIFVTRLSEENIQKAYQDISTNAKEQINASPYRHRGWIEYRVTAAENPDDVKTFLQLRLSGNQKSIG